MKTNYNTQSNINVLSLDDIIFEGRNHAYGAFYLRKHYNQFLIASFIFTASLAVGIFVTSFINRHNEIPIAEPKGPDVTIGPSSITDPPPPPPPPDLPVDRAIVRMLTAGPPVIVSVVPLDEPVIFNGGFNPNGDPNGDPSITSISSIPIDVTPDKKDSIFLVVEESADFHSNFGQWVVNHIKYPDDAVSAGVKGRITVQFVINAKGKVENAKVLRGIHPDLDQEAIRVISNSPLWTPGKQRGNPVKQLFTMAINFQLNN
jgi:periplasmic protein TonB